MRPVVARWNSVGFVGRLAILALTGLAWSASSLLLAVFHADYWTPVAPVDYVAIYAYTTAWLLTAASLADPPRGDVADPGPVEDDARRGRPGAPWRASPMRSRTASG